MKFKLIILVVVLLSLNNSLAQNEVKRKMYYGNLSFSEENYEDASEYFEDAVSYSPLNFKANYNLANTYHRLNKQKEAIEIYEKIVNLGPTTFDRSKVYHNIGNAHMMSQNIDGAIEAYENALRLNPSDEESRYNLAYALFLKQEQQKQDQDKQENDEQNENGENGDKNPNEQENNDENNSDQDNKDQNNSDQENNENKENQNEKNSEGNPNEDDKNKTEGGQKYGNKMSKEDIEQLLNTYYKREKDLLKKLNQEKRVGYGAPRKKDW